MWEGFWNLKLDCAVSSCSPWKAVLLIETELWPPGLIRTHIQQPLLLVLIDMKEISTFSKKLDSFPLPFRKSSEKMITEQDVSVIFSFQSRIIIFYDSFIKRCGYFISYNALHSRLHPCFTKNAFIFGEKFNLSITKIKYLNSLIY